MKSEGQRAEIKPFVAFLPYRLANRSIDDYITHAGILLERAQICGQMIQGELFYFSHGSVALVWQ